MLDIHIARSRAVQRAIETGEMPNFDLIHTMQRSEGFQPCFGRTEGVCHERMCRWHGECVALATFRPATRPPASGRKPRPPRQLLPVGTGTFRDGNDGLDRCNKSDMPPAAKQPHKPQLARPL